MAPPLVVPPPGKAQRTYRTLVAATRVEIADNAGRFSGESVAQRAGMAPATFYTYFPSKDEALAAALDEVLAELVGSTIGVLTVEQLLDEGLRAVLHRAVTASVAVFTESALVLRLALARLPESRSIRDVYRHHQRHATTELERFIGLGRVAGKIRESDEIPTLTTVVLVLFQGINNPLLLGSNPTTKRAIERLVDVLEQTLGP